MKKFPIGARFKVSAGSGIDSNRTAIVLASYTGTDNYTRGLISRLGWLPVLIIEGNYQTALPKRRLERFQEGNAS